MFMAKIYLHRVLRHLYPKLARAWWEYSGLAEMAAKGRAALERLGDGFESGAP